MAPAELTAKCRRCHASVAAERSAEVGMIRESHFSCDVRQVPLRPFDEQSLCFFDATAADVFRDCVAKFRAKESRQMSDMYASGVGNRSQRKRCAQVRLDKVDRAPQRCCFRDCGVFAATPCVRQQLVDCQLLDGQRRPVVSDAVRQLEWFRSR